MTKSDTPSISSHYNSPTNNSPNHTSSNTKCTTSSLTQMQKTPIAISQNTTTITSPPIQSTKSDNDERDTVTDISERCLSIISKLKTLSYRRRKNTLLSHGYQKIKTISPTLQGQVFIAQKTRSHKDSLLVYGYIHQIISDRQSIDPISVINICYNYMTPHNVVIKTATKTLYENRMNEDIVKEANLMSMFMKNNPPKSLIKYHDFFEDEKNYYLVMEQGGNGLFEFVVECHQYINQGLLSLKEWKKTVRIIFTKMVNAINWMHNVMHVCNLDISLENIVMSTDTFFDRKSGKIKNLDIRFIDFGLTEMFDRDNIDFICSKFVGKQIYKSPQVFNMETFRANKADIWSLGISLFMMSIGAPLYSKPCKTDPAFQVLMENKMVSLLKNWDRLNYIGKSQYDLLMKMLCFDENERICISDIMKHKWIKSYFCNNRKSLNDINNKNCKRINHDIKTESFSAKRIVHKRDPSLKESETCGILHENICVIMND